jgi:hypothetical protein
VLLRTGQGLDLAGTVGLGHHDDHLDLIPVHPAVHDALRRHPGLRIGCGNCVMPALVAAVPPVATL